jgi:hypothetical protein
VGNPEGRGTLETLRHRWEDNIKTDIQEVEWGWWGLVNAVMNFRVS